MKEHPLIEIDQLCHDYDGKGNGIKGISLQIFRQEFILVAGRNGSGKSTLFRHLNALLMPTTGEVRVNNISTRTNPLSATKSVGLVFQDADTQIVGETAWDDIAFGPENLKLSREKIHDRVESALEALGLETLGDRNPASLSGGEKRRLAIAGVMAMAPEVLVLDEPFSNLDHAGTLDLIACIEKLHRSGCTIILSTHEIEKVFTLATRMIILDQGKLVADDTPHLLLKQLETFGVREPCASRLGLEVLPWAE
ncbi:CbiO2 [Desulforapulum autotrophicum HRM2]|uniref:CbiO2 n=1 Tax=Desulforapulum autotrophicum (strain ATCC 43914 / DSM 3382 / VKM B-1955 / HRM2) TaxID=177437 RepID=C0QI52_DESAH|nr:ABC transporter ATP-binding protein [Desulforapulum autotrophicum]ACN15788.1 CbiO2 [Desulforapulum autotrophicum HRM2]